MSSWRVRTPGRTALKATERPRSRSRASKTTPKPPLPISFTISKRPTTMPGRAPSPAPVRAGGLAVPGPFPPSRRVARAAAGAQSAPPERRAGWPGGWPRWAAGRSPAPSAGRARTSCSRRAERPSAPGAFTVSKLAARRDLSASSDPGAAARANCSRRRERPSGPATIDASASTRMRDLSASGAPEATARAKCSKRAERPSAAPIADSGAARVGSPPAPSPPAGAGLASRSRSSERPSAESPAPRGCPLSTDGVTGAGFPDSPPVPEWLPLANSLLLHASEGRVNQN